MSTITPDVATEVDPYAPIVRSRRQRAWSTAKHHPLGLFGLFLVVVIVFMAAFGPMLTADPDRVSPDILASPSGEYWFGTDRLGRDYFARVVAGARLTMSLALGAMVLGAGIALVVGMVSAYAGGLVDLLGQRVVDMLLAFPGLVLLLLLAQVVGRGWESVALGLGVLYAVGLVRIIRANTLATLAESYVESARVIGATPLRILFRHVLPNMGPPLLIYVSALIGGAILAEGALSFLGLGIAPPEPSWGRMLTEARVLWNEPHLSIFPGVAMTIAVLGFNLVGDSVRDIFDPRLRGA
jgi:ABC-type dipeptide/oligopeptide/nickel transport system permease subunit